MRWRSRVAVSSLLLALFIGAGLWLLDRAGRVPAPGERPVGEGTSLDGEVSPGGGLAGEAAKEPAGPESSEAASDPSMGGTALPISIEGRVTDASGNGVANARVAAIGRRALTEALAKDTKLLDREPLEALRAFRRSLGEVAKRLPACLTAADGAYALRGLPDGDHRVVVAHPEFLTHGDEVWILIQIGRKARYDVELAAGQTIAGIVRDARGDPVAGARVQATSVERARLKGLGKLVQIFIAQSEGAPLLEASPEETDRVGAFRLTSLAPGTYDLRAVKEGYAWGEALEVVSGTQGIVVVLEPAIRVTGRVLSPTEKPIAGARIVLREPERDIHGPDGNMAVALLDIDVFGEKERGAATDEEGRFVLEAFSRGAYDLIVRAEGFSEHSKQVALEGATLELGDIVLAESREIAGTVLSPDGRPVDGAAVWVPKPSARNEDRDSRRISVLEAGPSSSVVRSQTDRQGAFRLTGLAGDSHEIAILAEGYPGEVLANVAADGRSMTITLNRGLTIRGRVVDAESGDPVPGARVVVEVGAAGEQTTNEEGRFEFRGVSLEGGPTFGASVAVRASREGYREARETVAFPDPWAAPVADAEVALRRAAADEAEPCISGIVRDAGGDPIANALVWVEVPGFPRAFLRAFSGNRAKEVRTGADGTFAVPPPRVGQKRFDVLASYPGLATSRVGPFTESDGESSWPFVEIRLSRGVSVEGRVTSLDGAPVPGARVRIWRVEQVPDEATIFTQLLPQSEGETTSSAHDGTYRLRRIEPGVYRLEARAQGYAAKTVGPVEIPPGRVAPAEDGGAAADAPARIDLVLDAGASIEGRVVDVEGNPLRSVEVVAFPIVENSGPPPDPEDEVVQTGALGAAAAVTGADGAYRIEHLPDVEFHILARARGFEPASLPSAAPGQSIPDLVLVAHAKILGRVRDAATGVPVRSFSVRFDRRDAAGNLWEAHRYAREVNDVEGRFACEGLRAGEWRVRVDSKAHAPWQRVVNLEPGSEVGLDVALDGGRRIEGAVMCPDGAPIVGATITARLVGGERRDIESTRSGEDGGFVFAGLEGGSYQVQAAHPEYYAEGSEGEAKVEISSADAAEAVTARLALRPAGKILGRIRGLVFKRPGNDIWIVKFSPVATDPAGADARGARGAEGAEERPRSRPAFECWADESGTFQRDSVRPGWYRLTLTHRRSAPDLGDAWVTMPPGDRPLGEVEIRAGEMVSFDGEAP